MRSICKKIFSGVVAGAVALCSFQSAGAQSMEEMLGKIGRLMDSAASQDSTAADVIGTLKKLMDLSEQQNADGNEMGLKDLAKTLSGSSTFRSIAGMLSDCISSSELGAILKSVQEPRMDDKIASPREIGGFEVVKALPQQSFTSTVAPGDYSGIAWVGGDDYVLADDSNEKDGFRRISLRIGDDGKIVSASTGEFVTNGGKGTDAEGIAFLPSDDYSVGEKGSGTIWISSEDNGEVLEYGWNGALTGRRLNVPDRFKGAPSNQSLEALDYNPVTETFWITSENMLKCDGDYAYGLAAKLRLQSFRRNGRAGKQYAYMTDDPVAPDGVMKRYAFGVSDMLALDDGRVLVLEREFYVPEKFIGAWCRHKIYLVDPSKSRSVGASLGKRDFMAKHLVYEFSTSLAGGDLANFEGMALGPRMKDGTRAVILVSDSQGGYGGLLRDWFKVLLVRGI